MTLLKVTVLDYGSGNVHSACKALEEVGASVILSSEKQTILQADGLLIPGVGSFQSVMEKLESVNAPYLIDQRVAAGKKVLGICVGMQVMFESGTEHGVQTEGIGQWPGVVSKLNSKVLPHIGWSRVTSDPTSVLFSGLDNEMFYFVHSYAAKSWDLDIQPPFVPAKLAWAKHEEKFLAAVENGPLSATQFHPEKSGAAGLRLLKNWVQSLRSEN